MNNSQQYVLTFYCTNPNGATFNGKKIHEGFNSFVVDDYSDYFPHRIENAPNGMTISEYAVYDLLKMSIPDELLP